MKQTKLNRVLAVFVTLALALQGIMPPLAYATERTVELDNHTVQTGDAKLISGITIDGVDKPIAGAPLDNDALVTTDGEAGWDIPVLWVRDDLQLDSDKTDEGHAYLPALAFFVPQGYMLKEDVVTVVLSDSLSKLFGTNEIISVYNEATGITYIIPASIKGLFASSQSNAAPIPGDAAPTQSSGSKASAQAESTEAPDNSSTVAKQLANTNGGNRELGDGQTLVEMHCAQTARNALTDEDLQWLVELIIDYLEPQAVNLLLYNFPAFNEAAKKGEIGKEISLYVYYKKGDKDGIREHENAIDALAYVTADAREVNGKLKYCYMLAVNVDSLLKRDKDGKPVRDQKTGRYTLVRKGEAMEALHNTLVHELFHAFMDDYNRTGMAGGTKLEDLNTDANGRFPTVEAAKRYTALRFPSWFIEGSAAAVEHVFTHRHYAFEGLRRLQGSDGKFGTGALNPTYTSSLLIDTYLNGHFTDGAFMFNDIGFCEGGTDSGGHEIDTECSNYVTGYLATLYLSELAARYAFNYKESSVKIVDGVTTIDSNKLREGLDLLLRWMHVDNESLDALIGSLSPKDGNGQPIYKDNASFQELFIKGEKDANGNYQGDKESLQFVTSLLNHLLYLDNKLPEGEHPTGSILEDFGKRYTTPLDQSKKTSSDYLKINNKNTYVPSTVKSDTAGIGGGKSVPNKAEVKTSASSDEQVDLQETPAPEVAKAEAEELAEPVAKNQAEPAPEAEAESAPEAQAQVEATSTPTLAAETQPQPEPAPETQPEPMPVPVDGQPE